MSLTLKEERITISGAESIGATVAYTDNRVNHILREIDDDNSVMTAKKQYGRLASRPMHKAAEEKIKEWLSQFHTTGNGSI